MTFELLSEIIQKNNIPANVQLLSDSAWECGETEMNGVWYNQNTNMITFTQEEKCKPGCCASDPDYFPSYKSKYLNTEKSDWKLLYPYDVVKRIEEWKRGIKND